MNCARMKCDTAHRQQDIEVICFMETEANKMTQTLFRKPVT